MIKAIKAATLFFFTRTWNPKFKSRCCYMCDQIFTKEFWDFDDKNEGNEVIFSQQKTKLFKSDLIFKLYFQLFLLLHLFSQGGNGGTKVCCWQNKAGQFKCFGKVLFFVTIFNWVGFAQSKHLLRIDPDFQVVIFQANLKSTSSFYYKLSGLKKVVIGRLCAQSDLGISWEPPKALLVDLNLLLWLIQLKLLQRKI